jgi:two-component system, chemotaxis family, sensor histidine kinase and response regulator WspE
MNNYSILELFKHEVAQQVALLEEQIELLKTQNPDESALEKSIESVHIIYAMANLIERNAVVELTHSLEQYLTKFLRQNHVFSQAELELVSQSTTLITKMSQVSQEEWPNWLENESWEISGIKNALVAASSSTIADITDSVNLEPAIQDLPKLPVVQNNPAHNDIVQDESMFELFRLEVEMQVNILNNGLLSLESNPTSIQDLEALMRSAHSVKGAARIVGFGSVVNLAHVMEDCFVAAQKKQILIQSNDVDILLQGVDELSVISQVDVEELQSHEPKLQSIYLAIANILNPQAQQQEIPQTVVISTQEIPQTVVTLTQEIHKEPTKVSNSGQERIVRVNADNLNRIMGLAGETLISANWLEPFTNSLIQFKSQQLDLIKLIEDLRNHLSVYKNDHQLDDLLRDLIAKGQQQIKVIGQRIQELEQYDYRTISLSDRLYNEVITTNMRPFSDGVQGFPRMLRDLARQLNKQVNFEIIGKSTPVDRDILIKLEAPLTHILRNALDHGLETTEERLALGKPAQGNIKLEAFHRGGMLAITISDDGRGIDIEKLKAKVIDRGFSSFEMAEQMSKSELLEFLFLPGFSTSKEITEISGRGVGLDIVKSMTQEVAGNVRVSTVLGKGTSFHFQLPLTLSVIRTLLVEIAGEVYAFALARIDRIIMLKNADVTTVEGRQFFTIDGKNIGLIAADQIFGFYEINVEPENQFSVVVISDDSDSYGVLVERFLGERDLVVRPLDPRLGKVKDISALALDQDGSPVLIIDTNDLIQSINQLLDTSHLTKIDLKNIEGQEAVQPKTILVVDDSITVRETERKLLENRGYQVDVAVDGLQGWNAIRTKPYDLVISDIDMPRMNGIELIKNIRNHPIYSFLPIIVVSYRDRQEDRLQGMEAGANYYLTKSSFEDNTLVEAVANLLGT